MTQTKPACEYFGECGGCVYQHIPYDEEILVKENWLKDLLAPVKLKEKIFSSAVPSPAEYNYRNRLDISFRKRINGEYLVGFKPEGKKYTLQIQSCAIAKKEISNFIPELREQSIKKLPEGYKIANLVVKAGDDGRVFWGGMGRGSLELPQNDYLWTDVNGRMIFYSLDTFFQANSSILPLLMDTVRGLNIWKKNTVFFDLYSGVGLFTIMLHDLVKRVIMIEESTTSLKVARYNVDYHNLKNVEIREGKVENSLRRIQGGVAMIDPPRKGLSPEVLATLVKAKKLSALLYLSCNPEALARDLLEFKKKKWKIERVIPFDFFPKTKHLETLVLLKPK